MNDRLWALGQLRATSYGAVMRALADIARFDSTRWIADIDVPTSVLIPLCDRVIPPRHQRWVAEQIPDAHAVTVDAGHAGCTMQWKAFVPGLRSAVDSVPAELPTRAMQLLECPRSRSRSQVWV